ncbi:MAG: hypothetical protein H7Y86_04690 [Rhizobacter sp.]|nr:hypothetical protein [Ferruginibacter sp.]
MIRIIPAVILLFVFASCSNENNPDDQPGTRLVKVMDMEDPTDSSYYDRFTYDNEGRVTEIFSGSFGGILATFYYNGAGLKPYKMDGEFDETTHFFEYDASGRLIRDSSIDAIGGTVYLTTYSYFQGLTVSDSWYEQTGAPRINQERDSFLLDAGNNVLQARYYRADDPYGDPSRLTFIEQFSYDNKVNPLGKLNIAFLKKYDSHGIFETTLYYEYFQEHNLVKSEYIDYDDVTGIPYPIETEINSYQYHSNSYPKEATYAGPGYMGKVLYTYE